MKSLNEALDLLISQAKAVDEYEEVSVTQCLGRILAKDAISLVDVPPLDNSQMDGYALRSADINASGLVLEVSQRIPAGSVGQPLKLNTVARIFTGAPIPEGADAVVMQEACDSIESESKDFQKVKVNEIPKVGQWIRRQGEDLKAGSVALTAGSVLRPQELGVAASAGLTHLMVKRRVKVAIFFTGNELTMPGEPLKPGAIYNSNRDTLLASLNALGCEVTDFGIVPDDLGQTRLTLRQAAQEHDLIITSGGVSVGEEDHVKPAVDSEGELNLWQISIKPGKPLAFGKVRRDQEWSAWFIGLPGNPVSSFVTFLLCVRPFIATLQGRNASVPQVFMMRADFDWLKPDKRNEFLRVKINSQGGLDLFPNQSSGVLTSAVWGDGLLDNPPSQVIRKGDLVRFIPFSSILF